MYNERKDTFSVKDIIVQVLCILLFIFLLLWLFPTKSFIKKNYNGTYSSSDSTVNVEESEQVVDAIFNFNVQTMKEAAISYYTTSRLPAKVGDTDTMSLRKMLSEKLILSFLDSDNKQCDLDNSYVQITKLSDEYTLKVNLVCPASKSDYIIVHLGCYDYCKGNVCEKKTTTTTKPKTYKCKIDGNVYWGSNYTKVTKAEYEKQCKGNTNTNINVNNNNKTEVNQTNNTTNNTNKNTNNNSNTTNQVNNTTNQTNTATVTNKQEANVNIGGNNTGNITINNDNRTTINQTNTTINNTTINNNTTPTPTRNVVTTYSYQYKKYETVDGDCSWTKAETETKTDTLKCSDSDYTLEGTACVYRRNAISNLYCPNINGNQYTVYNSTQCISSIANDDKGQLKVTTGTTTKNYTGVCNGNWTFYKWMSSLPSNTKQYSYKVGSSDKAPKCTSNCGNNTLPVYVCTSTYTTTTTKGSATCLNSSYTLKDGHCYLLRDKVTEYVCGKDVHGNDGKYNKSTGKCEYTMESTCKKGYVKSADGKSCVKTVTTKESEKVCSASTTKVVGESWSSSTNDATLISEGYVYTGIYTVSTN